MESIKNKRYLGLAGIILLIVGIITPYFTWNIYGIKGKISLIGYWEGYVILVAAVAIALFIFKDFVEKYVPNLFTTGLLGKIKNANSKFVIIPIIIAALVAIYLTTSIDVDKSIIKHGLGFYSLWLGVICLVGHTFLYKPSAVEATVTVPQQPVYNPQPVYQQQAAPIQQSFEQPQPIAYDQQPSVSVQPQQNTFIQQPTNVQPEPVQQQPAFQQPAFIPQNQPAKFCPNCGTQANADATFCPNCGNSI